MLAPWIDFVGRRLEYVDVLTYDDEDADRSVPWGVRLLIGGRALLVAAVSHEDPFGGAPCADEIVVAHDAEAVRRLVKRWSGLDSPAGGM